MRICWVFGLALLVGCAFAADEQNKMTNEPQQILKEGKWRSHFR